MLLSLSDIKSNGGYMYIQEYDEDLLLQYGPYIVMTGDYPNLSKSISYAKYPILKLLLEVSNIIKVGRTKSIAEVKKTINETLCVAEQEKNLSPHSLDATKCVRCACLKYRDSIREYQFTNKLLESAMINSAPIIPYSGVIRSPNLCKETLDILDRSKDGRNSTIDFITRVIDYAYINKIKLRDVILQYFYHYIMNILISYTYTIDAGNYSGDYNLPEYSGISKDILSLYTSFKSNEVDFIRAYYILAYFNYIFNIEDYMKISEMLGNIKKNIYDDGTIATENLIYIFMNNLSVENKDESLFATEAVKNMEYQNDKKIEKLIELGEVKLSEDKIYNIDILLSHLSVNQHYKTDKYTNSLVLNEYDIVSGYSYFNNDIMICEINDKYLCVPVTDLSDNNKIKFICLNKDGQISIKDDI